MFDVKRLDVFRRNNWDTLNFHQVTDVFPLLLVQSHGINEITQVCIDTNLIQLTKKIRQSERPILRHEKTSRSVQVSVNFFRKLMVKLLSRYIKQQLLQLLVTASARSSSKLSCSFSSTSSNSGPHLIRSTTWKVISCTHFLNWVSHHCRSWHSPSPDTLPDTFFTLEAIYAIYRKIWHTDSPESPLLLRRTSHFRSPPVPRRSSRNLQEALLNLKAMRSPHSDGPRQSVCCNKMTFQHRLNPRFNQLSGKTRPRCKLLFPSHSCFRWWRKSLWLPDSNPEKHWGLLCQKHPRTIQLFINLDAWTFTFNIRIPYTSIIIHILQSTSNKMLLIKSRTLSLSCRHIPGHPLDRPPYPPLGRKGSSVAIPLSP